MPYIRKDQREDLDPLLEPLIHLLCSKKNNSGELVYVFYRILKEKYVDPPNADFDWQSTALKVLNATEHEYYRRMMAPYENKAIRRNGDI